MLRHFRGRLVRHPLAVLLAEALRSVHGLQQTANIVRHSRGRLHIEGGACRVV